MSYCVSHVIGCRLGGVFGGEFDGDAVRQVILRIAEELRERDKQLEAADNYVTPKAIVPLLEGAISPILTSNKGTYVSIAGVFNYWHARHAAIFCQRLSAALGYVLHAWWDEETGETGHQLYLDGSAYPVDGEGLAGYIRRVV